MNRQGWRQACLAFAVGGATLFPFALCSSPAFAGGLYFTDRGVRPMGRGGAFVAGADDLGAIFYNPAGIVHAKRQVLADMGFVLFHSKYTRRAHLWQVDPNTGEPTGESWERTYVTSEGSSQILPIPTLAVSYDFGIENAAFAIGMWAPYAASARYEAKVAGKPNLGRYMLLNLDGSALAIPGIWAAYRILPELSVGAGLQMLMGQYRSRTVMRSCLPDRWMCAPEGRSPCQHRSAEICLHSVTGGRRPPPPTGGPPLPWPRAVAHQPLSALAIQRAKAHPRVQREPLAVR